MVNGEWGMGNGEWGMGNGKWEMGNGNGRSKIAEIVVNAELIFFSAAIITFLWKRFAPK